MDSKTFYHNVVLMRRYQRDYFRTRSGSTLEQAKQYERIIDDEIARVEKLKQEKLNQKLPL
jgi:hypothetical protein